MNARLLTLVLAIAPLALLACSPSSGGSGDNDVSCTGMVAGTFNCLEYKSLPSTANQTIQQQCQQIGLTFATGECPTSDLIGCCTMSMSGTATNETCYYGDAASAQVMQDQQNCSNWSTTP